MEVIKKVEEEKSVIPVKVESFSKFKQARMVSIAGNFMKGKFNISQNKIKAILDNKEILQKFANGEFNDQIDNLCEDEILMI